MVEDKIAELTDRLKGIFTALQTDKVEFKKLGISFEEKAFYDILVEVRNTNKFEYPDERCKELAKKIKALVDETSLYADWLTNSRVRDKLANQLTRLIYKEGYPPEWDELIFDKVLEQVENFKEYSSTRTHTYDFPYPDNISIAAEP